MVASRNSGSNLFQKTLIGFALVAFLVPVACFNSDVAADAFRKAGHYDLAVPFYETACKVQQALAGKTVRLADAWAQLASCYAKQQHFADAIRAQQTGLVVRSAASGAEDTEVFIDLSNVANYLVADHRAIEAEMIMHQALQQLRQRNVPDTAASAYVLCALALAQVEQEKWRQAIETYDRAVVMDDALMAQRKLGLNARDHLAALYARLGSVGLAQRIASTCVDKKLQLLGPDNVQLALSYETLGKLSNVIGDHEKATDSFAAAIRIYKKHYTGDSETLREIKGRHQAWLDQKPIAQNGIDQGEDIEEFQNQIED